MRDGQAVCVGWGGGNVAVEVIPACMLADSDTTPPEPGGTQSSMERILGERTK